MTTDQFIAILALMMSSDPWPLDGENELVVIEWANTEAKARGYANWIDAYMQL
jgi:hypothetical protein